MSKTLIYLIAVFAMWMYFSFSSSANGGSKPTVKDFDAAGSGSGGTMTSNNGLKAGSVFVRDNGNAKGTNRGTWKEGGGFGSNA